MNLSVELQLQSMNERLRRVLTKRALWFSSTRYTSHGKVGIISLRKVLCLIIICVSGLSALLLRNYYQEGMLFDAVMKKFDDEKKSLDFFTSTFGLSHTTVYERIRFYKLLKWYATFSYLCGEYSKLFFILQLPSTFPLHGPIHNSVSPSTGYRG